MNAKYIHASDIDHNAWDSLVSASPQGCVFMETAYLNTILPGKWSGIVVYKDNDLQAVMPLSIRSKPGFQTALQPFLTKYWGIAFQGRVFKNIHSEFSWKKKVVNAVLEAIPGKIASFDYNFHPSFDYPLPFHWKKYRLQTRYTYYVDSRNIPIHELTAAYSGSLKSSLKTAAQNEITIIKDSSAHNLVEVFKKNADLGRAIIDPAHYAAWDNLFSFCETHNKGFSFTAIDRDGKAIASLFYLTDHHHMYALAHTMIYSESKSDALSLLVHKAISTAAEMNLKFDFLGSMSEAFETFNRRFGGRPIPYLNISKKNWLLTLAGK